MRPRRCVARCSDSAKKSEIERYYKSNNLSKKHSSWNFLPPEACARLRFVPLGAYAGRHGAFIDRGCVASAIDQRHHLLAIARTRDAAARQGLVEPQQVFNRQ